MGFPCGSAGKESVCNAGDLGLIPGLGRAPGVGKGYPLQYSGPGDFHGLYSPWGHKELDMTEQILLPLWELNKEIEISYISIMSYMVNTFVKTHQTVYLRSVHFIGHKLLS